MFTQFNFKKWSVYLLNPWKIFFQIQRLEFTKFRGEDDAPIQDKKNLCIIRILTKRFIFNFSKRQMKLELVTYEIGNPSCYTIPTVEIFKYKDLQL